MVGLPAVFRARLSLAHASTLGATDAASEAATDGATDGATALCEGVARLEQPTTARPATTTARTDGARRIVVIPRARGKRSRSVAERRGGAGPANWSSRAPIQVSGEGPPAGPRRGRASPPRPPGSPPGRSGHTSPRTGAA